MSIVVVTQEGGPATRTPASVYVFITKKKKNVNGKNSKYACRSDMLNR